MSASDKLFEALTAALNPDNAARTAAEATLHDLSLRSGFFVALCDFICNASGQLPQRIRLMAASVAKQMMPKCTVPLNELQEVVAKLRGPMLAEGDRKVASQMACVTCTATVAILTYGLSSASEGGGGGATGLNDCGYGVLGALFTDVLGSLQDGMPPVQQHNSVVLIAELLQAIQNLANSTPFGEVLMSNFSSVRPQILARLMYIAYAHPQASAASAPNDDVAVVAGQVARDIVLQGIAEDAAVDEYEQRTKGKRQKKSKKKNANTAAAGRGGTAEEDGEGLHRCEASGTASIIREFSSQIVSTMLLPCREGSLEANERIVLATALVNDLVNAQYCARNVITQEMVSQLLSSLQRDAAIVRHATESYDGDDASIVKVAAQRWELLTSLLSDKSLGTIFAQAVGSSYADFTNLCVWHALVSDQIADEWIADANKFLQQEEEREDEVLWTLRDSAGSVCQAAAPYLGVPYVQEVLTTINKVLSLPLVAEGGEGAAGTSTSWKERECVLFLLEMLVGKQWSALQTSGFTDIASLFNILLSVDVGGPAVLASRALSLLAGILQKLKANGIDITAQFNLLTPSCIASLRSEQPLLRACACRLQYRLLKYVPQGAASSFFAEGYTQTLAMASLPGTFAELLYLALETADVWLSKCKENVVEIVRASGPDSPLAHAPETVVSLWQRHVQDPNIGELIVDILKGLLRVPECDASLCSCLGWMDNVLNGRATMAEYCTTPYIVELLSEVFRGASDSAASAVANATMGSLCSLLLTTEETSIISSASICLGSLLRRCPQPANVQVVVPASAVQNALTQFQSQMGGDAANISAPVNDSVGEHTGTSSTPPTFAPLDEEGRPFPLTTALTAISLTILSPDRSELSLMNVGSFLSEVARNAPNFSEGDIRVLIVAIATRLNTARTDSVIQELIQPLSILLQCHQDAFLAVLNAENLMQPFFSLWLPRAWSFFGVGALHQQATTLASFLNHWPSAALDGQMLLWKDPTATKKKSAVAIPLNVAVFASLCKTTLALFDQESTQDDEDEDEDELWQECDEDNSSSSEGDNDGSDAEHTTTGPVRSSNDPNGPQSPYPFLLVIKQFAGIYSEQASPLLSSREQKHLLTLCA